MELPFGGTFASDTFETGTRAAAWGGVTTIVDFALQRTGEDVQAGLAEWHRKADGECAIDYAFHQIIGGVDDGLAEGHEVPHRARGRHELQALHGVPRRPLQRRRADPAGHADGRGVRRHDHDARRERHRDRRARGAGARLAATPTPGTTATPGRRRWRPRPPIARSCWRRSPATCRSTSCTCPPATRSEEIAAARHDGRNVFAETCPQYLWLTLEETLATARVRGRQVGLLDPAALAERRAPPSGRACGGVCARTSSPWSAPTTARSASRTRRSWAWATSRRSRTGSAGSSTGWS